MMMQNVSRILLSLLLAPGRRGRARQLNVVTTTEDLGSLTREVGGDKVAVTPLPRATRIRTSSIRSPASSWL